MIRPILGALTLAAALLTPARVAAAQGTSETMPHPITSVDVSEYADRLKLSPEQRRAAESAHDDYKLRFRALREGEIEQFLGAMRGMQEGGMMPRREVVDAFMDKMQRLQDRIRGLDDSFFSELEGLLDDSQRPGVEHLRLARARQRCRAEMSMGMVQGPTLDISRIYWDLDLPADAHANADPMVASYERQLTRRMLAMHEASGNAMRNMFTIFEELDLEGASQEQMMADPQILTRLLEAMKQRWAELSEPVVEEASEITGLNRRTVRQVAEFLPGPAAGTLRMQYLRRAYPEVEAMAIMGQEPWLQSAEQAGELSEAQRAEVAAIIDTYRRSAALLVDETCALIDARRESFSPFSMDPQAFQSHYQELARRQAAGRAMAAAAQRDLEAIVGEGRLGPGPPAGQQVLGNAAVPGGAGERAVASANGTAATIVVGEAKAAAAGGADPWLPPPITQRDIKLYIERLALDETLSAIATQMHADYASEVENLAIIGDLKWLVQGLWQVDPATGEMRLADDGTRERVYALRRAAFDAIVARDRAFFENLQSFVLEEQQAGVERLRRGRERQAYRSIAGMNIFGSGQGSQESSLDIVDLCQGGVLADGDRDRIGTILAAYESEVVPALRARYQACLERQQVMDKWSASVRANQGDQAAMVEASIRFQETMTTAGAPAREAGVRLAELNRRTLDALVAALPEAKRRAFRGAYNRQAFPTVYVDPVCVEEHLGRALALKDLSADQVAGISTLAGAYWIDYEALSRKMTALTDAADFLLGSPGHAEMTGYMQRQEELEKLRFDRDELSYRAISRIQGVLSPDQVAALGGLPKPKAQSDVSSSLRR